MSCTDLYDSRFAGADGRLLRIAQRYGLDLAPLDTRSLPIAVADAIAARGLSRSQDMRDLVCDLLREPPVARPTPGLSQIDRRKRERLARLNNALLEERFARPGTQPAYRLRGKPTGAKPVHGALKRVYKRIAETEGGVTWQAINDWCDDTAEARELIGSMKPVVEREPLAAPKPPRGTRMRR